MNTKQHSTENYFGIEQDYMTWVADLRRFRDIYILKNAASYRRKIYCYFAF